MYMDIELSFPPSDFDVVYCLAGGLCGPSRLISPSAGPFISGGKVRFRLLSEN